jgi:cytochrome c553
MKSAVYRLFCVFAVVIVGTAAALPDIANAANQCPFNLRADNSRAAAFATVDAQLLARYINGARDGNLVASMQSALPSAQALAVQSQVTGSVAALDIDGDGALTAVDSVIVSRYLAGFRGVSLTNGVNFAANASRNDTTKIEAFFAGGCTANAVVLPIEVIGAAGYSETVNITLDNVANIARLWVKCHRCAFRDTRENVTPQLKARVRLNGGAWVNLDDATAGNFVEAHEKAYGGIRSGLSTVRFSVPIVGARLGINALEFQFVNTDGHTSGYRILDLNFLRADGSRVLKRESFIDDDPALWRSTGTSAEIAAGKALWNGSVALVEAPTRPTPIKATCAACHAADGRDLKYFNYSNWSIQERSKFHGLSETQGQRIAAYIRSLDVPYAANARPWNPPYQPGPGLDSKPQHEWAAGAGLDAVLERDGDMLPYLFPNGTSASAMRAVMDTTQTLNAREMPIALQFPDWNEWLPEVHPIDYVGDPFKTLTANAGKSLYDYYVQIDNTLKTQNINTLISNGWLQANLTRFAEISTDIPTAIPLRDAAVAAGKDVWTHWLSVLQWGAVKQWELMHTYGLEDKAAQVKGAYGEARSWLSDRRNVFELAPHRMDASKTNRDFQSLRTGKFKSTSWYQLQLVLNAGNRTARAQLWPMDWNYQPDHIKDLQIAGGPAHPMRYLASHIKMHQLYRDGRPLATTNFGFRQTLPHRWAPQGGLLDELPSAWRANAYSGLLNMLVDNVSVYAASDWPRGSVINNTLEPTNYIPITKTRNELPAHCHNQHYADCWYSVIPIFKAAGVDQTTINRMIDWSAAVWPAGDWNRFR